MIVHHHAIVVAKVRRVPTEISCDALRGFLSRLVTEIGMEKIFEPIAIDGKFGFTGVVGIVTSHIAFHYFDEEQSLHFDLYSCKEFDLAQVVTFVDAYWGIESADVLFLKRAAGPSVQRFKYSNGSLVEEL